MKRFTIVLAAVVMALGLSCCTSSPKEAILNEVNEFFAQAEAKIGAIDNAADLMAFVKNFATEKENFEQALDEKYKADENGVFKGMNAEGMEALLTSMKDRSTAYNEIEYAKCSEIMEPYIARVETALQKLQDMYNNSTEINDELVDEYVNAAEELESYGDIVTEEIADRYYKADEALGKIFDLE